MDRLCPFSRLSVEPDVAVCWYELPYFVHPDAQFQFWLVLLLQRLSILLPAYHSTSRLLISVEWRATRIHQSQNLSTASPLLVYSILKVSAHSTIYFSRNSVFNFQKFPKDLNNRTYLKFLSYKRLLIICFVSVQSTWRLIFR